MSPWPKDPNLSLLDRGFLESDVHIGRIPQGTHLSIEMIRMALVGFIMLGTIAVGMGGSKICTTGSKPSGLKREETLPSSYGDAPPYCLGAPSI